MINNIKDLKSKEEVLEFFKNYLKENIELQRRQMESSDVFDSPAWSSYQANALGAIRAYNKILALIPDREK